MIVPGSIYEGKDDIYVAIYTFYDDMYRTPPLSIQDDSLHATHVKYKTGGVSRGIDVFPTDIHPKTDLSVRRTIRKGIDGRKRNKVDREYDINYEINADLFYSNEMLDLIREDIKNFCGKKIAKHPEGTKIQYFKEIIPLTEAKWQNQKQYLRGGKQEFVPSCALDANLDFSWGCVSGFVPDYDLGMTPSFDGQFFRGFKLDIFAECGYCYASYQHKSFPKTLLKIDPKQLEHELRNWRFKNNGNGEENVGTVRVLRLGKRTEAGSKYTIDSLVTTLETCARTGTRVILPTKYLDYDEKIAELLKKTDSSVLFSIGWDELEKGACLHGCTNQWRLEQAIKYHEAGVNSSIYLLIDAPHPPREEQELKILKECEKRNIPIQFLPIRIPSKELTPIITGMSWEALKSRKDSQLSIQDLDTRHGGYFSKSGVLTALSVHPSWLELISNDGRIRMCYHNECTTWCGQCFLRQGFEIPTQHVDIDYKIRRQNHSMERRGRDKRRQAIAKQPKLKLE